MWKRNRTLGPLSLLLLGTLACTGESASAASARTTAGRASSDRAEVPVTFATIGQLQERMASGELTAVELVERCLARIRAFDRAGPELNAMVTVDADGARARARELDAERQASGPRGPLHGIPVILKDNYDTADLPTTGGSAVLAESIPPDDAATVRRLREAGAIVLGKSNMSEFAASYGKLGYGSVIGQTKNPHNLPRDPSGSSSGSAAAVAAGYAALATGTDTVGSIRAPAAVTGTVGIKPTMGLVSRDGIIPASLSFDVAGPQARTVADAAIGLAVMAGMDTADPATEAADGREPFDPSAAESRDALEGTRIGVVRAWSGANPGVDAAFRDTLERLEAEGAELVEVTLPEPLGNLWSLIGPVLDADFVPEIEAYFATLPEGAPRTVAELIARAEALSGTERPVNPGRIQGFRDAQARGGYEDEERNRLLETSIPEARRKIAALFTDNDVQALVFPTIACPASVRHDAEDDTYVCEIDDPYRPSYVASLAGYPEISVPAGEAEDGLPVGISLMGQPFSEGRIVSFAADFEAARGFQPRPPSSTPLLEP